jgi:hypothetical protein
MQDQKDPSCRFFYSLYQPKNPNTWRTMNCFVFVPRKTIQTHVPIDPCLSSRSTSIRLICLKSNTGRIHSSDGRLNNEGALAWNTALKVIRLFFDCSYEQTNNRFLECRCRLILLPLQPKINSLQSKILCRLPHAGFMMVLMIFY